MNEEKKPKKPTRTTKSAPTKGEGSVVEVFYRDGSVEQFHPTELGGKVSYTLDLKTEPPILVLSGSSAGEELLINFCEVKRFATL